MGDGASTRGQPLETLLEELDPSSSELAREALGWILPEPCPDPSRQIELQEFLWCQLSFTWLAEAGELPEIAWSLADLFTAAGLEREAALCRAPATHRLLDALKGHEPVRRTIKPAIRSCGVDPPDTPLLRGPGAGRGRAVGQAGQPEVGAGLRCRPVGVRSTRLETARRPHHQGVADDVKAGSARGNSASGRVP